MITFKKLRYKNFLSSGNIFTEIDLQKNKTNLIIGENGSGKSTILDALSYVLFNKSFRGVNKPELVNTITKKNCVVEVEFNNYKIIRGMKPNIFEIWRDGKMLNQDAALKDYQDILENNILKLKHKSFNQIVVIGSANFVPFMQLPAAQRREVIEDLLDLQIFSFMNILLKERIQTNKNDILDINHKIDIQNSKIAMQKKHINTLQKNNDELKNELEQKIQKYKKEIDDANNKMVGLQQQLDEYIDKVSNENSIKKNIDNIKNIKLQIDLKRRKLEETIKFYSENDVCPTCNQAIEDSFKSDIKNKKEFSLKEINSAIVEIEEKYENLNSKLEEIFHYNNEISELNNKISSVNIDISTNNKFITLTEKEIQKLQKRNVTITNENIELEKLKNNVNELNNNHQELSKNREILSIASTLLKDGGIKSKIIKQYIPIMNKLINKYLTAMDTYIQFNLDENFNESITSRNRENSSYYSFSQGERMRVDLSLLFTWRAISKIRNSATTNLLIMDEVLDSSLDSGGIDEFLTIIQTIAKDSNIFIISHKEQMLDKFDNVLKFVKQKNFSRLAA